MGDFEEDDLDEHLRFGHVEVGDDVADLEAGLGIGDDDDVVRGGVHGNRGAANGTVVVILAGRGGAGTAAVAAAAVATAAKATETTKPAETATTTAAAATGTELRVGGEGRTEQEHQRGAAGFLKITGLHNIFSFR